MSRLARSVLAAPLVAFAVAGVMALAPAGAASASTVVAFWHMNETSGTTMTDSVGHHNGTLHGVTLGVSGVLGKAYSFNGKAYAEVPNTNALNPGNANVTISFYLNTTSLPKTGDYDLVRKGDFPSQDYKVELLPTGQIKCTFQGSVSRHNATGGSGLNNGKWHHIVCVKTATQILTEVDGKVVATTNATVGSISNTTTVDIGAHPGSDWYKGELDEVSIAFG